MLETIQSHLLTLILGYAVSLALGTSLRSSIGLPLRRIAHERIRVLEERLNRRSVATRVWRGLIVIPFLLVPALALDWFLGTSGLFAGIMIALTADIQPCLWFGWSAVSAGKVKDEKRLARATSALALEPETAPDHHGSLRLIMLSLIHHFSIVLVGGACWFALLGLKGMLGYYTLATAALYFGASEKTFGWAATKLFALADAIPSLIGALLLSIAGLFVPKARPFAGLSAYSRAKNEHHAHLIAGTLRIALGGPKIRHGAMQHTPWIGEASAQLEADDLARFMTLFSIALFEFIILLLFIISLR